MRRSAFSTGLIAFVGLAACNPRVELGRLLDAGAAEVVDGGAAAGDGGVGDLPDGGTLPQFGLSDLRIEPGQVSLGQGLPGADGGTSGLVLSYRVTNGVEAELRPLVPTFLVDGVLAPAKGFDLIARPENLPSLPRGTLSTYAYDVFLRNASGTISAAPGAHTVAVRLEAFSPSGALADVDGGSTGGEVRLRPPPPVTAPLVIQNAAEFGPLGLTGPDEVVEGEPQGALIELAVTNSAAAPGATFTELSVDARLAAGETGEDPPAGLTLDWVPDTTGADLTRLEAGALRTFRYRLLAGESVPPAVVRVLFAVTAKDANSGALLRATASKRVTVSGPALVVGLATEVLGGVVALGQSGVRVTLLLDNTRGLDDARISDARLRFHNADDVDTAARPESSAGWIVDVATVPALAAVVVARGQAQVITFTARCAALNQGQLGENTVNASFDYRGTHSSVLHSVGFVTAPGRVFVTLAAGPTLPTPAGLQGARFGAALAGLGPVTASGSTWPAVAIGAPEASFGSGAVYFWQFVAATDGTVVLRDLPRFGGLGGTRHGSTLAAVGNWESRASGDASNELAVGRPGSSDLAIFNVAAGSPVVETLPASYQPCSSCELGFALAGNPRGRNEGTGETVPRANRRLLAVGAPGAASSAGRVDVFWQRLSAEAGGRALLHRTVDGASLSGGANAGERFGAALAVADLDGDGEPDLLIGAPAYQRNTGEAARGRVYALRGPDYTRPPAGWTFAAGETAGEAFGSALVGVGDVDGDGQEDFAVGAPKYSLAGRPDVGRVYVLSGATAQVLYTLEGRAWTVGAGAQAREVGERFGAALAPLFSRGASGVESDFNGDSQPDFAVGAPDASPGGQLGAGAVYVHTAPPEGAGAAGRLLARFEGVVAGEHFGAAVAGAGDLNADGFHDLLVGAPDHVPPGDPDPRPRGRVSVLLGGPYRPYQRRPWLVLERLEDGAAGTPPTRGVTLGQRSLAVRATVRNLGDLPAENVSAGLVFRSGGARVPHTTSGCVDNVDAAPPLVAPALVRVCKRGTHPLSIAARGAVVFELRITLADFAAPGEWEVSVAASADEGGFGDIPVAQRHLWRLEYPAQLQVTALRTTFGGSSLGFTALNRGTHVDVEADLVNTGGATVSSLGVALDVRTSGGVASVVLAVQPLSPGATTLAAGESATAHFRVRTTATVLEGQEFEIRAALVGVDVNSGLAVDNELSAVRPLHVITSRALPRIVSLTPGRPSVHAGEQSVPFTMAVVLEYDVASALGSPTSLSPLGATLLAQNGAAWPVVLVPAQSSIPMCPHEDTAANPCPPTLLSLLVDIPADAPPGPVVLLGRLTAMDLMLPSMDLVVFSADLPLVPATVEVSGP